MSTDDLTNLRKIAEAATQDEWRHDLVWSPGQSPEDKEWMVDSDPNFICSTQIGTDRGMNDATHIATFDPPTVLALIARLEQAEQAVARVRELAEAWHVDSFVYDSNALNGTLTINVSDASKHVARALDGEPNE